MAGPAAIPAPQATACGSKRRTAPWSTNSTAALGSRRTTSPSTAGCWRRSQWALDHREPKCRFVPTPNCSSSRCGASTRSRMPGCSRSTHGRLLVNQLDQVRFEHVRREFNKEADRLSNLGDGRRRTRSSETGGPPIQPTCDPRACPDRPHHPPGLLARRAIGVEHVRRGSSCRDRRRGCARPARQQPRVDRRWRPIDPGTAGPTRPVENQRSTDVCGVSRIAERLHHLPPDLTAARTKARSDRRNQIGRIATRNSPAMLRPPRSRRPEPSRASLRVPLPPPRSGDPR